MKKLFLFFVVALLVGCVDYTDDFNAIDDRLDALELIALPSIEKQVEDINTQLTSLKATDDAIKAQITELENISKANTTEIADLKAKDQALEQSISNLQSYVDTQIANAKSEAAAAYATIAQYNDIVAQLTALQGSTDKLGEDLTAKINTEVASLNSRIADLEARLKAVEDKVENLLARIQSISYIPTYTDGKATIEYTNKESKATLDFEISPKDAVAELAKVWDSAISVKAIYTQTRAVEFIEMPVDKFEADTEKGIITVTISGENLSEEFYADKQGASISLSITDGNNSVTSEYIPMTAKDVTKELIIVADKTTIKNDGIDTATFTIYYDGIILTEGYSLYEGDTPLTGNTFSSNIIGSYDIWGSYEDTISNNIKISVIEAIPNAPNAPEDIYPSKTHFVRRILLTQFLGTGCGYDPYMINAMHQIQTDEHYNNKVVITAAHLFNSDDPCYLTEAQSLDDALRANAYPSVYADLNKQAQGDANFTSLKNCIDNAQSRVAVKGGIAVNSEYHAEEEYIVLTATVKAKETTEFRIGAWLLEDSIQAKQDNYGITALDGVDFNTHNNTIRLADSKVNNLDFTGYSLGVIEAGKTASREFAFKLKTNGEGSATTWNHDNLRVIIFISTNENG